MRSATREAALDLAREARSGVSAKPPPWPPSVNAGRTTAGAPIPSSCVERRHDPRARDAQPARLDALLEELAVLGARDHVDVGADQLDPELGEDARLVQLAREVERGLAAHRRQEGVGALAPQHGRDASTSSGSRYVRSAKPGSVMIVAGFELTTIVRKPSSRSTFSAWQPA